MVGGSRAFQASGWASDGGMPLEIDALVGGEQPVAPRVLAVRSFFFFQNLLMAFIQKLMVI